MIKLSQWAKDNGVTYATAYNMFKTGRLPVKATQLKTGTILVEPGKGITCRVVDISGSRSFFISIDIDLDEFNVSGEVKKEILESTMVLARNVAHKIGFRIDENSVSIV